MRTWEHSGFSVDESVLLAAGDQAGIERLVQYMTRCPPEFVQAGEGERHGAGDLQGREGVVPLLPRPGWRRPASAPPSGTIRSSRRWISWRRVSRKLGTQHIPAKGSHLIRYYGWYSNKSRGMRKKAAEATGESCTEADAAADAKSGASDRSRQSWAMLIKRPCISKDPAKSTH